MHEHPSWEQILAAEEVIHCRLPGLQVFLVNPTSITVCISCFFFSMAARQLWARFVFRAGCLPPGSLPSILSALSGLIPYLDHNDSIVPGLLL